MAGRSPNQVFLSYSEANQDFVDALARRLRGDARLSFWLAPWHSVPGERRQEQMEAALDEAQSCAVFISDPAEIKGWQNEQMRAAIQTRVEDKPNYRIIPVLLPGVTRPKRRALPRFLRLYEPVEFRGQDDETAYKRLLAGILGVPPIEIEGYIEAETTKARMAPPSSGSFEHGHALVIGVASYPHCDPLPEIVLDDARDLRELLIDPERCGYPKGQVTLLLEDEATGEDIRRAIYELSARTGPDDTAGVFFSGHGDRDPDADGARQYILPYDADLDDLAETAIDGEEMTEMFREIRAGRLLVLFDSCHSGGAGEPKAARRKLRPGLSEEYYQALARGRGPVVMASSRPEEESWALDGMDNSLFTHYLLEALRGECKTLGDGYVRVFDVFRHVADHVPTKASQHPVFKVSMMEEDFAIALAR